MPTQISPMLAVSDPAAAIAFYERAFGAVLRWRIGDPAEVAGLEVAGAEFFLARETPSRGTRAPNVAGHTTVRIELFVDDPVLVHERAVREGAQERSPVVEHQHQVADSDTPMRMLQGSVSDLFGHTWLIGKFLE